jgi:predicted patatin/cPLA2 family phospholipase
MCLNSLSIDAFIETGASIKMLSSVLLQYIHTCQITQNKAESHYSIQTEIIHTTNKTFIMKKNEE